MIVRTYDLAVTWTGNLGPGTTSYEAYGRNFEVQGSNKPVLVGSADPSFRGDLARYNPEELLVAALSGCHLLWYLHLCTDAGVVVRSYEDRPRGSMVVGNDGGGAFSEVVLRPQVTVTSVAMVETATDLHMLAHDRCFIANSVNFPVRHEPTVTSSQR